MEWNDLYARWLNDDNGSDDLTKLWDDIKAFFVAQTDHVIKQTGMTPEQWQAYTVEFCHSADPEPYANWQWVIDDAILYVNAK